MKKLSVNVSSSYPIYIDMGEDSVKNTNLLNSNLLNAILNNYCIKQDKRILIITDSHLINLLGKKLQNGLEKDGISVELLRFPAGEKHKTRKTKQQLEDTLLLKKYGRDTCLIALGGGVVLDLVGFLAATYCRGIPVIYIPTTLLAMVDASIGGKTGVNTPHGKNLIGTFTQPQSVLIDISLLKTLPEKEYYNGMVEMIKHSIIADSSLFNLLEDNAKKTKKYEATFLMNSIYKSCVIKKLIIEQDEKEKNMRELLNLGHTMGHAIEQIECYRLSHGEAVAIGILIEAYISMQYGYLSKESFNRVHAIFKAYGLPLKTIAFENKQRFQDKLMLDKKSIRHIPRCVLLDNIGKPRRDKDYYTHAIDQEHLHQAIEWGHIIFKKDKLIK